MLVVNELFRVKIAYEKFEIELEEKKYFYCNLEDSKNDIGKGKFIMHNGDNFMYLYVGSPTNGVFGSQVSLKHFEFSNFKHEIY